ncbi:helix-turn-helix transcriptional regulator [Brevundimonas vesicularis]|uniref:helix-turn-helix transcriptional regulator n=1 Tax=Brevundimonas vesicularis TaxID=41276 RepID=UPI0038D448FC
MARFSADNEASAQVRALGEALSRLRKERGLSQAEAGQRLGMSSQGWGLYEAGKRSGLFRPDVQRRLTAALGATPEDLMLLLTEAPTPAAAPTLPGPTGLAAPGRSFESASPQARNHFRLETDDLNPWAAAGTVLEYVPGRWPRRDQGCILTLRDGSQKARLYVRSDDHELVVRGAGALLSIEKLPRAEVASVSAVVARLDD